jgi:hypothetical protein
MAISIMKVVLGSSLVLLVRPNVGAFARIMQEKKGWRPTASVSIESLESYKVWLLQSGQKEVSGKRLWLVLADVNRRLDVLKYG